jgi:hypothetical protein
MTKQNTTDDLVSRLLRAAAAAIKNDPALVQRVIEDMEREVAELRAAKAVQP